ncbi:hypothetical protein [Kitasatospora camelliae]|uniref:Peptidase M11 gametolysin domain-containing protein n=1 Tax=Kitasatospora camelliae TaxID=3156397 RepID=A0AAU8K9K9_9ACTN
MSLIRPPGREHTAAQRRRASAAPASSPTGQAAALPLAAADPVEIPHVGVHGVPAAEASHRADGHPLARRRPRQSATPRLRGLPGLPPETVSPAGPPTTAAAAGAPEHHHEEPLMALRNPADRPVALRPPAPSAAPAPSAVPTPASAAQAPGTVTRPGDRRRAPLLAAATAAGVLTLSGTVLTTPAAADNGPQGTDRHAVVLVNFRNAKLAEPDRDREAARADFFGSGPSLATYYAAGSGRRLSVVPAKGDGVFGPFTLDMDGSGCDTGRMAELARRAIPDVTWDHLSIVMPSTKACPWWGLGLQPGNVTWFQEGAVKDVAAIVHEMGHNLGFAHQERQVCTPGSFTSCAADGYSRRTPMGGGGEKKGLSAPELLSRKWLTPEQVGTPAATTVVRLTPLHAPAGAPGVRAVDLPLGSGGDRIVVEYRTPAAGTPDQDVAQGVTVYRVPKGRYTDAVMIGNTRLGDRAAGSLTADAPLTDTATGLSIGVVGQATGAGADVRIQLGGPAPVASTSPAPPTQDPSTASGLPVPTSSAATDDTAAIGTTAALTTSGTAGADAALAQTGSTAIVPALVGSGLALSGVTMAVMVQRRRAS